MKHTAPTRVNAEISDLPIARLDAQDLEQSLPVREYLEQNGVAVVVNRKPEIGEAYHIICGDEDFVKETLEGVSAKTVKTFIVLLLGKKKTVDASLRRINAKIAAIAGSTIPARDIPGIFAYFITGEADPVYIDREGSPVLELKPIDGEHPASPVATSGIGSSDERERLVDTTLSPITEASLLGDGDRVARIISDVFGQKRNKGRETRNIGDGGNMKERKLKTRSIWYGVLLLVIPIMAPVLWYAVSLTMIAAVQWYGRKSIVQAEGSRIGTVAQVTSAWVRQGRAALALMAPAAQLVNAGPVIRNQERLLSVLDDIVIALQITADLMGEMHTIAPTLFSGGESDVTETGSRAPSGSQAASLPVFMDRMRLKLDELGSALGRADTQIRILTHETNTALSLGFITRSVAERTTDVHRWADHVAQMRNLLSLYRAAGGFDRKKTYLAILQNSMELRPTGGFIGSIAVVTVEHGMIEPPVIQDVYALDGQLKGHVDPPLPIKELLDQEHWYLRDSNWDPDFRESAGRAAWFYEKETGQSVDGVIALSTPLITDLLGVVGPLELPDYNDRITKENFFGKSLFYTKADFFPGSTQKKDFLGTLMVALMGKLTSGQSGSTLSFLQVVSSALGRGDIQFWFPQEEQAQVIAQHAGWAGVLTSPVPCESSESACMVDRVILVEANMGVNKVNALVDRSVKSRVELGQDGGVEGSVSITYRNASTDDTTLSGGGVYLAYLRSYIAADARVASVTLDGEEIPPKAAIVKSRTLPYRDADETSGGLTTVGVAFTVPPGMERTLTMNYRRGIPLTFAGGETTFVLSVRKQPGVSGTPLDAAIGYPAGWNRVTDSVSTTGEVKPSAFLANAREVRYNTTLDQTKTFEVKFQK